MHFYGYMSTCAYVCRREVNTMCIPVLLSTCKTRSLTDTEVTNFLDQLANKLWKNSCQSPQLPALGF